METAPDAFRRVIVMCDMYNVASLFLLTGMDRRQLTLFLVLTDPHISFTI